jgi:hypothetical protein
MTMTESSPATEAPSAVLSEGSVTGGRSVRLALGFAFLCFAVALGAALLQNFRPPVLALATVFDSGGYLMASKNVLSCINDIRNGADHIISIKSLSEVLLLNGPVLPCIGSAFFALTGSEPNLLDMRGPVILQAIMHAMAAAILALTGWRLTGGRFIGLGAGIVYALWPAAIMGASRFLTETVTVLIISATLLSSSFIAPKREGEKLKLFPLAAFAFGLCIALLMLVKAALAPAALLVLISVFAILFLANAEKRTLIASLLAAALGLAVAFTPWLMFTKTATGEFCLLPRRLPTFNLATGLNPETDGWGALQDTPLVTMFSEADGPGAVASAFYKMNPGDFYGRMARKPLRLFLAPWNDFKTDCLGIPVNLQVFLHQTLVLFGLFGVLAFITTPLTLRSTSDSHGIALADAEPSSLNTLAIATGALAIICGHASYIAFVADSRYGFTSIPCLLLFAIFCLGGRTQKLKKFATVRLAIAAGFIMIAFSLNGEIWRSLFASGSTEMLASCLTLGALFLFIGWLLAVRTLLGAGRSNTTAKVLAFLLFYLSTTLTLAASLLGRDVVCDWQAKLSSKEELTRTVKLDSTASAQDSALVLANIRGDWRAARLKVNGKEVDSAAISLLQLSGNPDLCNDYRTFGFIFNSDTDGLHQWRAFIVPAGLLKPGEENTISLSGSESKTHAALTGATTGSAGKTDATTKQTGAVFAPSIRTFSATKLCNNPSTLDPRLQEQMPDSVRNAVCTRRANFDAGTSSSNSQSSNNDLSNSLGNQTGQYHMFLLVADKGIPKTLPETKSIPINIDVRTDKLPARDPRKADHAAYHGATIKADYLQKPHLRLKISGSIDCAGPAKADLELIDWGLMQCPIRVAVSPHIIDGTAKRRFSFEGITATNAIDKRACTAMIKISSDLVPLSVSDLKLEAEPLATPALTINGKRWY